MREAYGKYKVSASSLEPCIEREYGVHIPHNRIHRILLESGLAGQVRKEA